MPVAGEGDGFLGGKAAVRYEKPGGCCRNKCCLACSLVTGAIGALLVLLGLVVVFVGPDKLEEAILDSMALTKGSDRTESWLRPPITPHLSGYAFHVKNPQAVLKGAKPQLEEWGPYVYKSVTLKDTDNNMVWNEEEGSLKYSPRKIYTFAPELSGPGLDPFNDVITVPNIPLWTGLHQAHKKGGDAIADTLADSGLGTPFVDVTFDGLLWGYNDELPCLKMDQPKECIKEGENKDPFSQVSADDFSDDDDFGDFDFKRRKREVAENEKTKPKKEKTYYDKLSLPKAEFVDCKCEWGLFRDRNVTMRKPIKFLTGVSDLAKKGVVLEYNNKK